jgi:osmotically-inducible protein OsmY
MDQGTDPGPVQPRDAAMREYIYEAFWKDDFLRAMESGEIDVFVRDGLVSLNGHIMSMTSQKRVENALREVRGIVRIENNLVLDDKLTLQVAASLGTLEHTYDCKFLTGVSHGVVSLSGRVSNENVKLMAERAAAANPNVRGVINHVRVSGADPGLQDQPFLQPAIGKSIYFLDGISGVVRQVIINPDNRRVIAMTLQGKFNNQHYGFHPFTDGEARLHQQLHAVPMSVVRYLTRVSGFLSINSSESNRYGAFDPGYFVAPHEDWVPPYPYCPGDVLFPIESRDAENPIAFGPHQFSFGAILQDAGLSEQLLVNDSLGG